VQEQAKKHFWILCHKETKARVPLSASGLIGLQEWVNGSVEDREE